MQCGRRKAIPTFQLRSGGTNSCGCKTKAMSDLTGRRFGKLVVVRRLKYRNKRWIWSCVCDCGGKISAASKNLQRGSRSDCGCLDEERRWKLAASRRKPDGHALWVIVFGYYRSNARSKGHRMSLTEDQMRSLMQQNCHYCGEEPEPYSAPSKTRGEIKRHGIDRVDNEKGYEIGNVVSCCRRCNFMKSSYSYSDFVGAILKIAANLSSKSKSRAQAKQNQTEMQSATKKE